MGLSTPLLIVAVVIPVLLVATNVVVFAKYVDPEHASGHALGTLAVVRVSVRTHVFLLNSMVLSPSSPNWRSWLEALLQNAVSFCWPLMWYAPPNPSQPHLCQFARSCGQVNQSGTVGCGSWNNDCGGFDMASLWEAMNLLIIVLVVGVFPFLMFAYELDGDTTTASRFKAPLPPREETSSAEPSSAGKAPSSLRAPRQVNTRCVPLPHPVPRPLVWFVFRNAAGGRRRWRCVTKWSCWLSSSLSFTLCGRSWESPGSQFPGRM